MRITVITQHANYEYTRMSFVPHIGETIQVREGPFTMIADGKPRNNGNLEQVVVTNVLYDMDNDEALVYGEKC